MRFFLFNMMASNTFLASAIRIRKNGYIGLINALWKCEVVKTSISALEASLLGQICVLRTSNLLGQLSAYSSSMETLCWLISMQRFEVVYKMATLFLRFHRSSCKCLIEILRRLNKGHIQFLDAKICWNYFF